MLYHCHQCDSVSFQPTCLQCGQEAIDDNVPLDPEFYPEFQYESKGVIKDLFLKKKTEKELRHKLDSVLEKYRKFEKPYFINYVHLTGQEDMEVSPSKDSNLNLFHNVLVRLGFDELKELGNLTIKLVRSTAFRFQYEDFIHRTSSHVSDSLKNSLRSWIDERGATFRQDLPLFLYYIWENSPIKNEISFSENAIPLIDTLEYRKILILCEEIYFDLLVTRFKVTLETFDPTRFITIYRVDAMNGYQFEDFLAELFTTLGYDVQSTKRSGDQGADLFAEKFGRKIVIQAKNYTENVGNSAVQQVLAAKTFYGCDESMVVTNSYFTPSAVELARSGKVTLVDRKKLQTYLDEYNRMILDQASREPQ